MDVAGFLSCASRDLAFFGEKMKEKEMTHNFTESYDIVVIGAGHAGVEASLAASRMGCKVLLATISIDMLAFMPCNPSIGGSAKGIVVREVDALGGEMAKNIDKSYIQMKMLNTMAGIRHPPRLPPPTTRVTTGDARRWSTRPGRIASVSPARSPGHGCPSRRIIRGARIVRSW